MISPMSQAAPGERFTCGPSRIPVLVTSPEAALEAACAAVIRLGLEQDAPGVGLATGRTFAPLLRILAGRAREGRIPLHRYRITHLDEFLGCGPRTPGGMRFELEQELISRLPDPPAAFLPVEACGPQPAESHARHLAQFGPRHLQLLGLGANGHLAFVEPGTPFSRDCHVTTLTPGTRAGLTERFPGGEVPPQALTLGPRDLLAADRLLLVALGASKARAVAAMLEGPVTPACPGSLLHLHPRATVLLDPAAASRLGPRARWTPAELDALTAPAEALEVPGPVLAAAPHPDDAAISCGGLLAGLQGRCRVVIAALTTGARAPVPGVRDPQQVARIREEEMAREASLLGAEPRFLRSRFYDTGAFEEADVETLLELLEELRPGLVLAPARADPHPTHSLARQVLDEALRRHVAVTARRVEVWTCEGPWYQHPLEAARTQVLLGRDQEARKLRAVRAHRSQLQRAPFDTGARSLARLRWLAFAESRDPGAPGAGHGALEVFVREVLEPPAPGGS